METFRLRQKLLKPKPQSKHDSTLFFATSLLRMLLLYRLTSHNHQPYNRNIQASISGYIRHRRRGNDRDVRRSALTSLFILFFSSPTSESMHVYLPRETIRSLLIHGTTCGLTHFCYEWCFFFYLVLRI